MKATRTIGILAAGLALAACAGATPAPKELTQANAELKRIADTDVATLAPAEVTIARDAVGRASQSAANGDDEMRVKELSNAALSRVAAAEAHAAEARALQATASSKAELANLNAAAQNRMLETERQARKEAEQKAQRQMDRLAKLANLKQDKRGYVLTLPESTLFKGNDSALLPSAKTSLDPIASVLKETDASKIEINAIVSSKVKSATQTPLSEKRAKAISDYLAAQGIPTGRLAPSGMGIGDAVGGASDPAAAGRIEIVVPAPAAATPATSPPAAPMKPTTPPKP